ncbi:hypothetical protein HELRODRAFT_179628 [Helobdella robusta]|uniref:Uncharacterized protein n=1 Tax=Helobdella robusta TaxID=6412 RepID=T1FEY6_HELRO|nr:hypothetical protein HELRODRAFT_179628 [Helobdella robusta]ESN95283.1 hypothetical protein HELRODRAFT_179628 [Helobdella robusta]
MAKHSKKMSWTATTWANTLHRILVSLSTKVTSLTELQTEYLLVPSKIVKVDGLKLVEKFKGLLEALFLKKSVALQHYNTTTLQHYSTTTLTMTMVIKIMIARQ